MTWAALGSRVADARKAAGLSQEEVARNLGVDRTAVTKIERGQRQVDSLELARLAGLLRRPIDWFVSPPAPAASSRRAARDGAVPVEADRLLEALARDVDLLLEVKALAAPPKRELHFRVEDVRGAEKAASLARGWLGVGEGPLPDLLRAVEALGVFVAVLDLGDPGLDGSYQRLDDAGVALVNGGAGAGRRRFTLAHELGHHVLADAYSAEWVVDWALSGRESLANAFAIHFLMPRSSVAARWAQLGGSGRSREAAITLAAEYGVSWTAVCAQLRSLGLVTEAERQHLARRRPTSAEYLELELEVRDDLPPPTLSPRFASAAIKAYRKHKLGAARVIEILRGTVEEGDLPEPDRVPLEGMLEGFQPKGR
jgi:Zn-dependent peptidase ImmA (M78 family)/DNA-binding XRE family transcriptional regulator